jgi:hypothetical protein
MITNKQEYWVLRGIEAHNMYRKAMQAVQHNELLRVRLKGGFEKEKIIHLFEEKEFLKKVEKVFKRKKLSLWHIDTESLRFQGFIYTLNGDLLKPEDAKCDLGTAFTSYIFNHVEGNWTIWL